MILGKKETTICKSNCLLYCISSFNFIAHENSYVWYNSPHFQLWDGDGLIWECLFSGLTKITAPRLLHHALPPFYKCWKLKLKRRERMKRLKTLEVKKLVALIKGEVLWLFQGAMQHQYVPLLNMELVAHCHLKGWILDNAVVETGNR